MVKWSSGISSNRRSISRKRISEEEIASTRTKEASSGPACGHEHHSGWQWMWWTSLWGRRCGANQTILMTSVNKLWWNLLCFTYKTEEIFKRSRRGCNLGRSFVQHVSDSFLLVNPLERGQLPLVVSWFIDFSCSTAASSRAAFRVDPRMQQRVKSFPCSFRRVRLHTY